MVPRGGFRALGRAAGAQWRQAPYLGQLGVVLIVLGTIGDTVAHAVHPNLQQGFTVPQQSAHLVILIGMVSTMLGILVDGHRRRPRSRGGSVARR